MLYGPVDPVHKYARFLVYPCLRMVELSETFRSED